MVDTIVLVQTGSNIYKRFSNEQLIMLADHIQAVNPDKKVLIVSDSEVVEDDKTATDKLMQQNGFVITRGEEFSDFLSTLNRHDQSRQFLASKDIMITAALLSTAAQTITTDSFLLWVTLAAKLQRKG